VAALAHRKLAVVRQISARSAAVRGIAVGRRSRGGSASQQLND
jgi:hypothetical protein